MTDAEDEALRDEGMDFPDIDCEMCGERPAIAVVEAPLGEVERERIRRALEALHVPRMLVSEQLMAVCESCASIALAALRDGIQRQA